MRKNVSFLAYAMMLLLAVSCNQPNSVQDNTDNNTAAKSGYLSVEEVIEQGSQLADQTVAVEDIIEHVCKHTWKRFKIVDQEGKNELKIELGDKFPSVDSSILGKKARVTGKLIPVRMNEEMVMQWEQKMKEIHKGEENTLHYKEELALIQNIYKQIIAGEIPYYTMYSVEAENYELE